MDLLASSMQRSGTIAEESQNLIGDLVPPGAPVPHPQAFYLGARFSRSRPPLFAFQAAELPAAPTGAAKLRPHLHLAGMEFQLARYAPQEFSYPRQELFPPS